MLPGATVAMTACTAYSCTACHCQQPEYETHGIHARQLRRCLALSKRCWPGAYGFGATIAAIAAALHMKRLPSRGTTCQIHDDHVGTTARHYPGAALLIVASQGCHWTSCRHSCDEGSNSCPIIAAASRSYDIMQTFGRQPLMAVLQLPAWLFRMVLSLSAQM